MAKIFAIIWQFISQGFKLIYKPARIIARLIFYKVIVKTYSVYLKFIKGSGWSRAKGGLIKFFLSQRSAHVVVISLTIIILFSNFVAKTNAGVSEKSYNIILSNLVAGEFNSYVDNTLIEESSLDSSQAVNLGQNKDYNQGLLPGSLVVAPNADTGEEEELGTLTPAGTAIAKQDSTSIITNPKTRSGIVYYTVKSGDTISTIADSFGISVNTILWENNLTAYTMIRPGQELAILPVSGISYKVVSGDSLGKISQLYDVSVDKIMAANNIASANQLRIGEKLIIPGGTKTSVVKNTAAKYTGISAVQDIISTIGKAPASAPVTTSGMAWPTVGHTITQYFSWRHTGLDIANKVGTPIYAADSGTVTHASWNNGGYGNFIIVDHGGGKLTRYAHLSKYYVKVGDHVTKGQAIGAMGSTGRSTGPHLHFEVVINGVFYNPLNYVR